MICLFTRDTFAKFINEQCFFVKFLIVTGFTILLLFVDNNYLVTYVQIAGIVSIIFLLYQSITLVDFGYSWNDTWVDKYDQGTTFYGILLIIVSIGLCVGTGYIGYMNFDNFWVPGCNMNKTSLVLNVMFILTIVTLVLLKYNENSSILTAFFVSLIFTYYTGSALSSYGSTDCNPFATSVPDSFIYGSAYHILFNLLLAFITCVYTSVSDTTSDNFKQAGIVYKQDHDDTADSTKNLNEINTNGGNHNANDDVTIYKTNEYVIFHLVMIMFSIYLTMIFFDWRKLNIDSNKWADLLATNTTAFSLKMINSIVFVCIYVWTLVAPAVLENRDFN